MRKPDTEIYELCVGRLGDGLGAEEYLFVDDREDSCAGAGAAGVAVVRYRDVEQAVADIRAALLRSG